MEKPALLFDKALIFRHILLFADLNFFERRLVLNAIDIVEFRKSETIYRQGDPPDAFYCILTGRVQIFTTKETNEEVLEYLHRGRYFGFISLLTGEPHSVSVRAVNDTIVVKITRDRFDALLKAIPHLAINLSQMLSRRLKRKDLHPKSIFESTIVSVYGEDRYTHQMSLYALNLGLSLKKETRKKVIVVDVGRDDCTICEALNLDPLTGFSASKSLFHSDEAFEKIIRHPLGIDILRVLPSPSVKVEASFLISLFTLLVNDYHYCVVNFSTHFGIDAFKVLAQSDIIHLLVSPDPLSLKKMSQVLEDSGIWTDPELKKKIKPIILEEKRIHGKGLRLLGQEEGELFHQPVFGTLPRLDEKKLFLITDDAQDPYARAVRRISRQLGEVWVGLALGGGSAMGMAHIGVLKVLEKEEVPIDIVTGSSIGAFIGALWCSGYSALEMEQIILKNNNKKYLFGLDDLVFPLHGLIKGKHIYHFLSHYLGQRTFHDLQRPFKIVACDCLNMKQVVFDSGRLIDAVMASISIPGVFEPYPIAGRYYIDGGIINPLPTDVLVESKVKKIISVNVLPNGEEIERTYELLSQKEQGADLKKWPIFSKIKRFYRKKVSDMMKPNIFDVIVSSIQTSEYQLAQLNSLSQADVALHPDMAGVSWSAFENAKDLIERGEEEARVHLKEIKELVLQSD
jgi:predicted acylesterase/phospholipase RssA/CRP-like cAMP-binding protein